MKRMVLWCRLAGMTFAPRAFAASLAFAGLLFSCQPSPPPPLLPAPSSTARAPEPVPSATATVASTATSDSTASAPPEPPPDPFEVELAEFCASGKGWVSDDGKRIAELSCGRSDEPPMDSVAYLSFRDVATNKTSNAAGVFSGKPPEERQKGLAQMKAILADGHWTAMTDYHMAIDDTVEERFFGLGSTVARVGTGEGLTVRFHEPELIITDAKGKVVHKRKYPSWSPKITRFGQYCAMFTDLTDVLGSRKMGLFLLRLESAGSPHFCEAFAIEHLVKVPPIK